jgi:hypothetical protein
MKPRHAVVVGLVSLLAAAGCERPKKNNDWRSPAPQRAVRCTSDADCRGRTCAIELGALQGTCTPTEDGRPLPPLPGADGGAAPGPGAPPNAQPSPNDIQI